MSNAKGVTLEDISGATQRLERLVEAHPQMSRAQLVDELHWFSKLVASIETPCHPKCNELHPKGLLERDRIEKNEETNIFVHETVFLTATGNFMQSTHRQVEGTSAIVVSAMNRTPEELLDSPMFEVAEIAKSFRIYLHGAFVRRTATQKTATA